MNEFTAGTLGNVVVLALSAAVGWLCISGRVASLAGDGVWLATRFVFRCFGWPLVALSLPLGAMLAQLVFVAFGVPLRMPVSPLDYPLAALLPCTLVGGGVSFALATALGLLLSAGHRVVARAA